MPSVLMEVMIIMAIPIKIIIGLVGLLGGSGGLFALHKKKSKDTTSKPDENTGKVEGWDFPVSETDQLQALLSHINNEEKAIIELINQCDGLIRHNNIIVKEVTSINFEGDDIPDELDVLLLIYLEQLSKIKESFQKYINVFSEEYANKSNDNWETWSNHLKLMYRDIAIYADNLIESFITSKEDLFDLERIKQKTDVLKALQEHYTNNC